MKPFPFLSLKPLILGSLALLFLSSCAQAWWNSQWSIRKKITVDTGGYSDAIGTATLLIRLDDGDFQFSSAADDGSDIRFIAADDKTPLDYHIEKYDGLMGQGFVWVKLPNLKPGTQTAFWLYYGSTTNKATPGAANPKTSYDDDTILVYHFEEKNAPPVDTTASGINAQDAGVTVEGSLIGLGVRFNGQNVITIPAAAPLAWAAGASFTWSAWAKPEVLQPNEILFSRRDGSSAFVIGVDNGVPYVEINGQRSPAGTPLVANNWTHLAVVADGAASKVTLYVDGAAYNSIGATIPALNSASTLGGDGSASGFTGQLDELEISKVARSPGFVKLAATEQGGGDRTAKVLSFGPDEQTASWLNSDWGVIVSSVTWDGWGAIVLLFFLAVGSWTVMITKALYLRRVRRGNAVFFDHWHHLFADLSGTRNGNGNDHAPLAERLGAARLGLMHASPLYHIYYVGTKEVESHVENGGGALSPEAVHAIRAALDTETVRQIEKINAWMVVLGVTASGGPFLGLAGTVLGVMMTFAGISRAGDVNVNAIAPGISGALLATFAGLAAAIPAMLGAYFLRVSIKATTNDIRVFVDEFVTKIAVTYKNGRSPLEAVEMTSR